MSSARQKVKGVRMWVDGKEVDLWVGCPKCGNNEGFTYVNGGSLPEFIASLGCGLLLGVFNPSFLLLPVGYTLAGWVSPQARICPKCGLKASISQDPGPDISGL